MDNKVFMYVSSWAEHGGVPGLGLYTFDQESGAIKFVRKISDHNSFNGSCVYEQKNKLYVNNEVMHYMGAPCASGRIFVYELNPETGEATETDKVVTGCPNPAYVSVDPTGRYLFEAHHSFPMGVALHNRNEDGSIDTRITYAEADIQVYELDEKGIPEALVENVNHGDITKKSEAHPHCAVFSPSGKLLAVADKGDGHLYLYTFDYEQKRLCLLSRTLTDKEGASPRYVAFHPTKPYLFVNHEASYDGKCYVTAFKYDENGNVKRLCVENVLDTSLPVKQNTRLEQQGFVISPDGKCLYTLINAADVIGVMEINQQNGKLTAIQNIDIPGTRPRGLAISPNGRYILSSCLVGGELTSYEIQDDGTLKVACKGPAQPGASYMSFYKPQNKREEREPV
ncbi:lactonase family protein [Blautia schinkii]|nr:lactonase family protein [Blautia schinkii]